MSQLLHALVHGDPSDASTPPSVPVIQHCVRPDNSLTPLLSLEISLLPRAPLPPVFMICIRPHQLPPDAKSSHPLPNSTVPPSSISASSNSGSAPGQQSSQQHLAPAPQQSSHSAAAAALPSISHATNTFLVGGTLCPSSSGQSQIIGDGSSGISLHP
jgi:hypothetical protein